MHSEFPPGMELLETRRCEPYVSTFYGTTPRAKNPKPTVRKTNKAHVHGKRHSQHKSVDLDDITVHNQDSRLSRTRRKDSSPTLRSTGAQDISDLRRCYPPLLQLLSVNMSVSIVVQALRKAQALRLQLTDSTTRAALQTSAARDQVRLLQECTTLVILYLFFNRGG
jgi:hypothetical protein